MMKVLLDVDGVIAKFYSAAIKKHPALERAFSAGIVMEWNHHRREGISDEAFWVPLDNYEFWMSVEPYPGAREFVEWLRGKTKVAFCTAPSRSSCCWKAKVDWIRKHIGPENCNDIIICGASKGWLAQPDTLLIDDGEHNIEAFTKAGGHAILVPSPLNRNRHVGKDHDNIDYDALKREVSLKLDWGC